MTSYSGDSPSAGRRYTLLLGLMIVSCIVTAVPASIGVIACQARTIAVPWFLLAALTAVYTFGIAVSTHPFPGGTTLYF